MKKGSTRWVFIGKKYVYKIPYLTRYNNFILGLLANGQEVTFSKIKGYKKQLMPIVFYLPLGFLVVMKKANEISKTDWDLYYKDQAEEIITIYNVPAELKRGSWGIYKNNLKAVDYG